MPVATEVKGMTAGIHLKGERILICSCGHNAESKRWDTKECPDCGTKKIAQVDGLNKKGKVRVDAILNVIEKDDKSFHIEKKELYVVVGGDSAELIVGKHFEMKWSLKDKTLQVFRNKKLVENEERYASFFRGITHEEVMNTVSTTGNRHLLQFAFDKLGKLDGERNESFLRALTRLFGCPVMELFNFSGFEKQLNNIWDNYSWKYSTETKPNLILGVPKYMMPYLKKLDNLQGYRISAFKRLDESIGANNLKMMLEMFDDESSIDNLHNAEQTYIELVEEYKYTNHKNLVRYLTRDIKLMQGISSPTDGARLLRDYVRMCNQMKINPEKYPKNLKKDHDVAAMNYRMMNDMAKQESFKKEMEKPIWDEILYKNKEFTIVKPIDPQELIREGETLGHCVASYVDDVIKGKCKVLFLRFLDTPKEGLVTVEVRGEDDDKLRVVQVRGRGNRVPTAQEKAFIIEWAGKKKMRVDYED